MGDAVWAKLKLRDVCIILLSIASILTRFPGCAKFTQIASKFVLSALTIEEAIKLQALPSDCPYVQHLENYKGVRPFSELIARYGSEIAKMI